MIKKFLKKVGVIIMGLSIFSLIGCSEIDKEQAADVEQLLQKKYNQEFEATHIGGRYGTGNDGTVTTYLHPKNNEDLLFSAVMNEDGKLVSDNYIPRLISHSVNEVIKRELGSEGIDSETNTVVMEADSSSETNPEISLREYVNSYKPGYFSADMIVKESPGLTPEKFESALNAVYTAGLKTDFQVAIHVISDGNYEACHKEFMKQIQISDSMYVDFDVVNEMKLYIDSEGFHVFEVGKSASDKVGE
ncbi:hypothetical protein [Neobacillus sp. Marseille-QA0830]